MASLSPKDRVSLCLFSFTDGRRCRTPRIASHPHFCFYHAQKETQSQAAETLAKDLAYFFSGDYLSANDLNTALGRLIPAVIRGQIKPRVARTVAYMLQTLLQSTRLARHEYINAVGPDGWRDEVHTSVKANHSHLFPSDPNDPDPEDEPEVELEEEPEVDSEHASEQHQPAPPTSVGVGLARPGHASQPPSPPQQPSAATPPPTRPSPADAGAELHVARSLFPERANAPESQLAVPTSNSASPTPQPNSIPANSTPAPAPSGAPCLPRRRPHTAAAHPFGTNIYTHSGNF